MILIVSAVFPPEPVVSASLSYDLANSLSINHKVTVISPAPTRPMGYDFSEIVIKKHSFEHIILNSYTHPKSNFFGRFRESYSFGKASARYINEQSNNIKAVYANTWPLMAKYFTVKAAKKHNIPIVTHIQDIYPESVVKKTPFPISWLIKTVFLPIDKYTLKNSAKIITISPKMKDYLVSTRNLKPEIVHVVRNWQDHQPFLNFTREKNPGEVFTFMYLGSLSPSAGVPHLIKSFSLSGLANCRLVIAGSGSELEKCKTLAEAEKNARIEFRDASAILVPQIQAEADVLLLPLKTGIGATASPSKLPAYMFSAKPIIACVDADSDTANAIRLADCGWVVPPENAHSLADCMQQAAITQPEKLLALGKNGREYALKHFAREACLDKFVNVIKEII